MKKLTKDEMMEIVSKAIDQGASISVDFHRNESDKVEDIAKKIACFKDMHIQFYPKRNEAGFSFIAARNWQNNISGTIYFAPHLEKSGDPKAKSKPLQ